MCRTASSGCAQPPAVGALDVAGLRRAGRRHPASRRRPRPLHRHSPVLRRARPGRRHVPFVTFGRPWDGRDRHSWVDVDGAAGTRAATEYLISLGHTRIGFIGWPEGSEVGDDRLSGWASAMRAADLPTPTPMRCVNDIALGVRAAEELIRGGDITAIVCVSDLIGLGTLSAASAHGLAVGPDLAVIGFDDSDRAQAAARSSIRQHLREVAEHCVRTSSTRSAAGPNAKRPNMFCYRPLSNSAPRPTVGLSRTHHRRSDLPRMVNAVLAWCGLNGPNWFADPRGVGHLILGGLGVNTDSPPSWIIDRQFMGLTWWQWLSGPSIAMCAIIALAIWTTSGTFVRLFLAALQDSPEDVEEAAMADGTTTWQRFRAVTLPALKPTMFLVLTLGLIGVWQVFDQVYIMSQGQPTTTTLTPHTCPIRRPSSPGNGVRAPRSPSFSSPSSWCSVFSSGS